MDMRMKNSHGVLRAADTIHHVPRIGQKPLQGDTRVIPATHQEDCPQRQRSQSNISTTSPRKTPAARTPFVRSASCIAAKGHGPTMIHNSRANPGISLPQSPRQYLPVGNPPDWQKPNKMMFPTGFTPLDRLVYKSNHPGCLCAFRTFCGRDRTWRQIRSRSVASIFTAAAWPIKSRRSRTVLMP